MPRSKILLLAALLLGAGCASRKPRQYRLQPSVLIPPGVASPEWSRLTVRPDVPSGRGPCTLPHSAPQIRRRGRQVHVVVSREALLQKPPGALSIWAAVAEERGCVAKGQAWQLASRLVESLPLDPAVAARLLRTSDIRSGYVDLGPETRLEVVGPITRPGAAPDAPLIESARITGLTVEVKASPNLIGFEKAWYLLRPKPDGSGLSLVFTGCERTIQGKTEVVPEPSANYLRALPEAAWFRLFYKADRTIAVLHAPSRAELDRRTLAGDETHVVLLPRNVALNPNLAVTVNGREVLLPVGSNVRRAIVAQEKNPETVLAKLNVSKLYHGRLVPVEFDPARSEILNLPLAGGEVLTWKEPPGTSGGGRPQR